LRLAFSSQLKAATAARWDYSKVPWFYQGCCQTAGRDDNLDAYAASVFHAFMDLVSISHNFRCRLLHCAGTCSASRVAFLISHMGIYRCPGLWTTKGPDIHLALLLFLSRICVHCRHCYITRRIRRQISVCKPGVISNLMDLVIN